MKHLWNTTTLKERIPPIFHQNCVMLITQHQILSKTFEIFPQRNLNPDKTEETLIKRGDNEDNWQKVRKLGSLLGDSEDMLRRNSLQVQL